MSYESILWMRDGLIQIVINVRAGLLFYCSSTANLYAIAVGKLGEEYSSSGVSLFRRNIGIDSGSFIALIDVVFANKKKATFQI